MTDFIQQKNVEQIAKWIQASQDIKAVQYVAQECILRMQELHNGRLAEKYTTGYHQALRPHGQPATFNEYILTLRDGFNFGCGLYLAGLVISVVLFIAIFILATIAGGGLAGFLAGLAR